MSEPPLRWSCHTMERSQAVPAASGPPCAVPLAPESSTRASLFGAQGTGQSPQVAPSSADPEAKMSASPFRESSQTTNGRPATTETDGILGRDPDAAGASSTRTGAIHSWPAFGEVEDTILAAPACSEVQTANARPPAVRDTSGGTYDSPGAPHAMSE